MRGQNEWPATIARLVFDQPPLSVAAHVVLAELREADGKIVIKTALRELVARGAYSQTTEAPEDPLDRPFVLLGVLRKVPYQEPGSRAHFAYELTEAGRELDLALGVLQQWGDAHLPRPEGPTIERVVRGTDRPAHVAFVDPDGRELAPGEVEARRTAAFPG